MQVQVQVQTQTRTSACAHARMHSDVHADVHADAEADADVDADVHADADADVVTHAHTIWHELLRLKVPTVLQCVAVCCSVLQCVAVCCSVLQCVAVCCSVLQYSPAQFRAEPHDGISRGQYGTSCYVLRCQQCYSMLQCVTLCYSVLQCVAVLRYTTSDLRSFEESHSMGVAAEIWYELLHRKVQCCSVLQNVAECCRMLQCVAVCCSVLQCGALFPLHHGAPHVMESIPTVLGCRILHCVAVGSEFCSVLQKALGLWM